MRDSSNIVPSEKDHTEYQKNVSKSDINNNNDITNDYSQGDENEIDSIDDLNGIKGYTSAQKKRRVEGKKAHGKKLSQGRIVQNKRWSYSQRSRDNRHMKNILSKIFIFSYNQVQSKSSVFQFCETARRIMKKIIKCPYFT